MRGGKRSTTEREVAERDRRSPLGVAEAAAYLGVTPRWVRRAVYERRIPFVKAGRLLLFLPRDLDTYLNENRVAITETSLEASGADALLGQP